MECEKETGGKSVFFHSGYLLSQHRKSAQKYDLDLTSTNFLTIIFHTGMVIYIVYKIQKNLPHLPPSTTSSNIQSITNSGRSFCIYHYWPASTTIFHFSTTKYKRPLLVSCDITPIFFRKRPKTETLLIDSFAPLFFCSER